ncbi:MAG: helix-turn-helix domain-containing protein [Polyangiales bacterium]
MAVPYAGTLELRAPGALSLRVEVSGGAPRLLVRARELEAWLEARSGQKLPLASAIAGLGEALSERALGAEGVLTADEAVMVVAALGGGALRLIPELLGSCRDAEAVAGRVLREFLQSAYAMPGDAGTAPSAPRPAQRPRNLTEHMETERRQMLEALDATRWDRGAAAERLGMPRRTFYRRMSEYGFLEGSKPRGKKAQRLRQAALEEMKGTASPQPTVALNLLSPPSSPKPGA